jgi:translation initiation factor 2-alpha kinase 3
MSSPLLLVSTLDGTLSALDASDQGNILWKIETGPGGLLSSSISKVELNSHGKLVRLIPSLDGGLYKFDGEGIEPIPISADSLLHSSYHAADDLLITGIIKANFFTQVNEN